MICGSCKRPFSLMVFLWIHWLQTGCQKGREIWKRVFEAKRRGTSGMRILRAAYPNVYKTRPMPPERLEKLRSMKESPSAPGRSCSSRKSSVAPGANLQGKVEQKPTPGEPRVGGSITRAVRRMKDAGEDFEKRIQDP